MGVPARVVVRNQARILNSEIDRELQFRGVFFCAGVYCRIGIKLPESDALTLEQKINKLMNLKIYIHEKGEFLFYRYIPLSTRWSTAVKNKKTLPISARATTPTLTAWTCPG